MATTTADTTLASPAPGARRAGRWIDDYDPEDSGFWESTGRRIARRNLGFSIFAEFIGFSVWQLWSIVAVSLPAAGFTFTQDQLFWLVAIPSLVGATLRLPYTFAVPKFGGRNWTIVSALLLILPAGGLAYVVGQPTTPFWVMVLMAALAGVGGGNFASSMANISFFYPQKEKGRALGLNAAGGNLGVAVVQLAVPLVVVIGGGFALERAGLIWIPLAILAAFLAWRYMDNLTSAKSDFAGSVAAAKRKHTWIMCFLYIGTFGSFIGYSAAFPLLVKTQFPVVPVVAVAFLGPLVGSSVRPLGGVLADRFGGARVTAVAFVVMAGGALGVVAALRLHSFPLFLTAFLILFLASGAGNGSTYRMIPAIFHAQALIDGDEAESRRKARREAAACIGIASAIGAYGGFLVPRGFALSTTQSGSLIPALYVFVGFYAVCLLVTWAVYLRRTAVMGVARV
ncbi:MAG TPA: MFS transporter [Cryptosporangiaceae bacterium]|nr:MFS transporter [Cryptosporangiaceae bacterium]